MVFGVFDNLHEGHKFFLEEAKKLGGFLTVVLARDEVVKKMKGKLPRQNFAERKSKLKKEGNVDKILAGDNQMESWDVFEKYKPDIIALGYDQNDLKKVLTDYFRKSSWTPEIKNVGSFEPQKYKSSVIGNN